MAIAVSQRTPPFTPELIPRVAVTLAALAAYRLGAYLPLPGIDITALVGLYQSGGFVPAVERISVVALGVMPIVSALLLVEVACLVSGRFNVWAGASADNARVERYVFIGAPLLAAIQAYEVANALENAGGLVPEPGLAFRLTIVATLVAGTAVLMWLATLISRHGLGSGIWLLLLTPYVADLPRMVIVMLEILRTGGTSAAVPVAVLACTVAAVVVLVALGLTLKRLGMRLDRTLIWPLWMSTTFVSVLLVVPWFAVDAAPWLLPTSAETRHRLLSLFSPGTLLYSALLAGTVVAVSLTQWRRVGMQRAPTGPSSQPVEVAGASPILLTALALAAIAVVPPLLTAYVNAPILIDGRWIAVLVAVALPVVNILRRQPG
jgi:preprotein translocase subunit SecY